MCDVPRGATGPEAATRGRQLAVRGWQQGGKACWKRAAGRGQAGEGELGEGPAGLWLSLCPCMAEAHLLSLPHLPRATAGALAPQAPGNLARE